MKNLLKTLVTDGWVCLTVADTTQMVRTARQLHKLSKQSTLLLGKALCAMTLISGNLKNEKGEISLSLQCDGACGAIGVSGNQALCLRGFIQNTELAERDEQTALGENGALTIIRDDGYVRPFVGTCALPKRGGIDSAFEEYYALSEQIPTRLYTRVDFDENGEVAFAGGAFLQALPFAGENILEEMAKTPLDDLLESVYKQGVERGVSTQFTPDKSVWELATAQYKCNCSRTYLSRVLVTLGREEFNRIVTEDGSIKVHCHYCNSDYEFTKEDGERLFKNE